MLAQWRTGRKTKQTPSGWISGNAVCCHHNGQSMDTRGRGGFLTASHGGFSWHCFNCGFTAGWQPGYLFSKNTKSLLKWIGLPESDIDKLALAALQLKDTNIIDTKITLSLDLVPKELPEMTLPLIEWDTLDLPENEQSAVNSVKDYLQNRGMDPSWYPWSWSITTGYRDRIIIPFYHNGQIVGWTGRKITAGKPKYLTESQPGYVFNLDHQTTQRQYVIVVEGPFDAIAIDGVAIMTNAPNAAQCTRINALNRQVIAVPDRDKAGAGMINAALEHGWAVSMPPWEEDIKDVADAVQRYGRLYTLFTIIHYCETNRIKIQLYKKKLEALNG